MTVKYVDGWYEIEHHPTSGLWAPREKWCKETFKAGKWQLRNPIYHYSIGPSGPGKRILSTTPLTWRFKREADALLFILRWSK